MRNSNRRGSAPPCPKCFSRFTEVKDSRPSGKTIRRRRFCLCGNRYTTYEITDTEMFIMREWRAKALAASLTLKELAKLSEELSTIE